MNKTMKEPINFSIDQINYIDDVLVKATASAIKACTKFPQPNYVLLKIAEEAGEVVKAGVHLSEGRDFTWSDLEGEVIQTIAMCIRLLLEGDQTMGLTPPSSTKELNNE